MFLLYYFILSVKHIIHLGVVQVQTSKDDWSLTFQYKHLLNLGQNWRARLHWNIHSFYNKTANKIAYF